MFLLEVRAAALYRLLMGLDRDVLLSSLSRDDETAQMLTKMIHAADPHPEFPTKDLAVLTSMIRWIAEVSHAHPHLMVNFAAQTSANRPSVCPLDTARATDRISEVILLTQKIHELGTLTDNPQIQAEFFTNDQHVFHPRSEFLRIMIQ
jgi:hypothetical protein